VEERGKGGVWFGGGRAPRRAGTEGGWAAGVGEGAALTGEGVRGPVQCGACPWAGIGREGERAQVEKKNGLSPRNSAISY
jgi:hypothetical protein